MTLSQRKPRHMAEPVDLSYAASAAPAPPKMQDASTYTLHISSEDGTPRHIALRDTQQKFTIGREDDCDLVLKSHEVSRHHATLGPFVSRGSFLQSYRLQDFSMNGTWAAQEHIQGSIVEVKIDTPLRIGPFRIEIQGPRPAPALKRRDPEENRRYATADEEGKSKAAQAPLAEQKNPHNASELASKQSAMESDKEVYTQRRRRGHRLLIEHLDLQCLSKAEVQDPSIRRKVREALERISQDLSPPFSNEKERQEFIGELCDEALGLGPLEHLIADEKVTEIMVVDPETIFIDTRDGIVKADARFTDDESVRSVIERIVTPLGRRIDESSPLVDARLPDGSRVNAVIRPLAIRGTCITIRKFPKKPLLMEDLVAGASLSERMARFLHRCVAVRKNIVISGGTGSGKTTLLNALSASIPGKERIVTIEDAAELQLQQPHVVSLETKPPNMEGKGAYTICDLVKNALRMRPDRIVVGECRGGEALDMLQAMNTGHDGSMTTTHANSPREAISRLETLCLMNGIDLPMKALRHQIASSIHLILQQNRFSDGSRRITRISEIVGIDKYGNVAIEDIFVFRRKPAVPMGDGASVSSTQPPIDGDFYATGYLPSFLNEFIAAGMVEDGEFL